MAAEDCAEVEARLVEALLARRAPSPAERRHANACALCAPVWAQLEALRVDLDGLDGAEPPDALVSSTRQRVARELAQAGGARSALPAGFRRECLRLLGGALAPLPLVVGWNLAILVLGRELLADWLPPTLLALLGGAYLLAAAGWLALLYGSIPLVAYQRAQKLEEASP